MESRGMESRSKGGGITSYLMNFNYGLNVESILRVICQVSVASSVIMFAKAMDGEVCGARTEFWNPSSWSVPAGCFIRSLVQNIPNDFSDYDSSVIEQSP